MTEQPTAAETMHAMNRHDLCNPVECHEVEGVVLQYLDQTGTWVDYSRGNYPAVVRHVENNEPGRWRGKHWTKDAILVEPTEAEAPVVDAPTMDDPNEPTHEWDAETCDPNVCQHVTIAVANDPDNNDWPTMAMLVNDEMVMRFQHPQHVEALCSALMRKAMEMAERQMQAIIVESNPELAAILEAAQAAGIPIGIAIEQAEGDEVNEDE